jgi:hypothetical protein
LSEVEAFYFVRYVNSEAEVFNAVITLAILLEGRESCREVRTSTFLLGGAVRGGI